MKIRETFENRKKNGQKALVTYIVSGDYGYETTKENIRAMVKAGADVIEIGIPFSDPIAEGVVIQEASQHSLAGGTTLKGIFQMVKELREEIKETPFVMMMYLNTIYRFGTEDSLIFVINGGFRASSCLICHTKKKTRFRAWQQLTGLTISVL